MEDEQFDLKKLFEDYAKDSKPTKGKENNKTEGVILPIKFFNNDKTPDGILPGARIFSAAPKGDIGRTIFMRGADPEKNDKAESDFANTVAGDMIDRLGGLGALWHTADPSSGGVVIPIFDKDERVMAMYYGRLQDNGYITITHKRVLDEKGKGKGKEKLEEIGSPILLHPEGKPIAPEDVDKLRKDADDTLEQRKNPPKPKKDPCGALLDSYGPGKREVTMGYDDTGVQAIPTKPGGRVIT